MVILPKTYLPTENPQDNPPCRKPPRKTSVSSPITDSICKQWTNCKT